MRFRRLEIGEFLTQRRKARRRKDFFQSIRGQLKILDEIKICVKNQVNEQNKILVKTDIRRLLFVFALLFLFSIGAVAQSKTVSEVQTIPAEFKSDNCTNFPDGDYADCCVVHDKSYYVGGSWKMRWRADKKLYQCVAANKGFKHKLIAPIMWAGVRVFGVPCLPTRFRWGFGRKKPQPKIPKTIPKTI